MEPVLLSNHTTTTLSSGHFLPGPKSSRPPNAVGMRTSSSSARLRSPRCAMAISIGSHAAGGFNYQHVAKFPRIHYQDPYKLLSVSPDASEEEIRGARNFLLQQYAGHERSEEAIEGAYERIMMKSFWERKKAKINLKTKLRKQVEESPSWVKQLLGHVEVPPSDTIWKRFYLFAFMVGWSIVTGAETGPLFQLALSLFSCIFFLNDKMRNLFKSSVTGFGTLIVGWVVGSLLFALFPSVLYPRTWVPEMFIALVTYVFLFLGCTFLK